MDEEARFARALDDCYQRVRRGEPLERCLEDYPPAYRDELARLVPLGERLGALRQDPNPAFAARLEGTLLSAVEAAAAAERRRASAGFGGFLRRLPLARVVAIALAALVIFAGSGAGIVAAADTSLPDSPLYSVKTAREWLDLALARNSESKVNVYTNHIAARAREFALAVRADKSPAVVEALGRRLAVAVDDMVDGAVELRAQGRPLPGVRALVALRGMEREAERLSALASPEVKPILARLQTYLRDQGRRLEPRAGL